VTTNQTLKYKCNWTPQFHQSVLSADHSSPVGVAET